jgi:hypothetical protein
LYKLIRQFTFNKYFAYNLQVEPARAASQTNYEACTCTCQGGHGSDSAQWQNVAGNVTKHIEGIDGARGKEEPHIGKVEGPRLLSPNRLLSFIFASKMLEISIFLLRLCEVYLLIFVVFF